MNTAEPLTLAELEAADPRAPQGASERRFCCPLCGQDKPQDAAHRSLTVNMTGGAWNCHRCHESGKLREFWSERDAQAERPRRKTRRPPPVLPPLSPRDDAPAPARVPLADLYPPLEGTPGADYLAGRGLSLSLCHASGVRYAPHWFGRAAVVFPILDRDGREIAAQGRYIAPTPGRPNFHTDGPKKQGTFATAGAWSADELTVVESPIDALSLAALGLPAVAFVGKSWPDWFPKMCMGIRKRVYVALDADKDGDAASDDLMGRMVSYGCIYGQRLRPAAVKDWNEDLLRLSDCRRLSRRISKQALFLQEGQTHPDHDRPALMQRARETLDALEAACIAAEGPGAHGYNCALDPFATGCLDSWRHALDALAQPDCDAPTLTA